MANQQGGGKWLAQFLYDKGLRGDKLAWAWAIAMKESGGQPWQVGDNSGYGNSTKDWGLFQINDRAHADRVRAHGWSWEDMKDPDKNFQIFMEISGNGSNYSAWGIPNPNGQVTGWAAHLQSTNSSFYQQNLGNFNKYISQFRNSGYAAAAGSQSQGADAATQADQQRVLNDAAKWARRQARQDKPLGYTGLCDHFVANAYGVAHSGYDNAIGHWQQTADKYRHAGDREPPPGALVFWEGGSSGDGHVAISLGNGKIVSTDISRSGYADVVSLKTIEDKWHMKYLGWAAPVFGGKVYKMGTSGVEGAAQATTGSGVGDGSGGDNQDLPDTPEEWAARFGLPLALLQEYPKLKALFDQAVAGEWDATRFEISLRGTDWYKNHRESWRQAEMLKYQDPATYQANVQHTIRQLRQKAVEMGAAVSDSDLVGMANKIQHQTWDDNQVAKFLAPFIKSYSVGGMRGQAGEMEDTLRQLAFQNGVTLSDDFYLDAARQVGAGSATTDQYVDQVRRQAASMFPVLSKDILGGANVRDLVSPYIQSMSNILGVTPNSVHLDDPYLKQALFQKNKQGEWEQQSLADFETALRKDDRYQYTPTAMNATTSLINTLTRSFGLNG